MKCYWPYMVANPDLIDQAKEIPVPCGKCPPCRMARINMWSFRLMQEEKKSLSAYFLTLTYDTTKVPITPRGYMTLKKDDVTLFIKRLRKRHQAKNILERVKYYYCGEYGTEKMRPHYHMIIFNTEPEHIEATWQQGAVHYGQVTGASVGYTLKYMNKIKKIPLHRNDDRIPEFSNMSHFLGLNYLTPAMVNYHKTALAERYHITIEGGKKIALPAYYKRKIYQDDEMEQIRFAASLAQSEIKQKEQAELIERFGHDWENYLSQYQNHQCEKMAADALRGRHI